MSSWVNIGKSTFCGVGLYQSYRYSRALAVGWKEQRMLCTIDYISSIAMLLLTSEDNLKFLGGDKLFSQMNQYYYLSLPGIPALHYLTKRWEDHEASTVRDVIHFTYVHLSDLVMVASAVQALAATYYGFNRAGNLLQLACMTGAIAEQGLFWMKPEEDRGLLFKINEGAIVRAYDPAIQSLNLIVGIPFFFLYRGLPGKFNAVMRLISNYLPQLFSRMIPDGVKEQYQRVIQEMSQKVGVHVASTPHAIEDQWIADDPRFDHALITEKHFELFKMEDQFPNQTLQELEEALQQKLERDSDPDLESIGREGVTRLTKREMLQELLGREGTPGYLRQHVITARTIEEKEEKEIQVKNVFGAIGQDWAKRKSHLVTNYDNFLCRTATGSTITELSLEFYGDINKASTLEKKIALIMQQRRDRNFFEVAQGLIMKMQREERETREGWEAEEAALYEQGDMAAYLLSYLKHAGYGLVKDLMYSVSTARHQININTIIYARDLNLSYYAEARRDVKMQLAKQLQDIALLDQFANLYSPVTGVFLRSVYANGKKEMDDTWLDELIEAIASYQDTRIEFDDVSDYLRKKTNRPEDFDEELIEVYTHTPTFDSRNAPIEFGKWERTHKGANFDQWFQEKWIEPNRQFESDKREFLKKYLPQVLYDLGYVSLNK